MNEFDDIEQLLKPQCEFKASETLKEEVMQINDFPPREMDAPVRKSSWPPVPLICRCPTLSAQICPYRSTAMQLLMEIILSIWPMI